VQFPAATGVVVGADKSVKWPLGVEGKGSGGVAGYPKQIPGSIGYVESSCAASNALDTVTLKNPAGRFVKPTGESFAAAAANAEWDAARGFYVKLTNEPAADAWPIVGASFILVPSQPADAAKAKEVLSFFDYSFDHGRDAATRLHYLPLPAGLTTQIRIPGRSLIKGQDGHPIMEMNEGELGRREAELPSRGQIVRDGVMRLRAGGPGRADEHYPCALCRRMARSARLWAFVFRKPGMGYRERQVRRARSDHRDLLTSLIAIGVATPWRSGLRRS
jgi:hypothetical protein